MRRKWLVSLLLVTALPLGALAADDDEMVDNEGEEKTFEEAKKVEITQGDLKALSDARASKSEASLVTAASRILGVDSKNLQALNALGVFYFEQGKLGMARILFLRALQDHADNPALHNNLAIVYLAEDKQRQALSEFRKAMDLKSDYKIAAANLGAIFLEYKDFDRAVDPLASGFKAIKSELKSGTESAVEVANNYAVALAGLGKYDDAKDIYEDIVAGSARNPTVLLNYAILLVEKLKNYKEGGKLLSRIKFGFDDPKILKRVDALEAKITSAEK